MSHHEIKFLIFRTFIKFYSNEFLKSQDTVQGDDWSERKKGKNKLLKIDEKTLIAVRLIYSKITLERS